MPFRYVAFYKPFGVTSQFTGGPSENTLAGFDLPKGIYAAGRLDKDSEGLLLLTDDGAFIKKLTDPQSNKQKTYWVQVERIPDQASLEKLRKGVVIKSGKTRPCQVRLLDFGPPLPPRDPPIRFRKNVPTAWLEIVLTEGKNRQLRRMSAAIGFPTLRLVRVGLGKLRLENLAPGQWRDVSRESIL